MTTNGEVDMAKQTKRPAQSRAGVKTLITVASIGCTLSGWMYFANIAPADTSSTAAFAQAGSVASSQAVVMPTVVPIADALAASNAVATQAQNTTQQNTSTTLRSVTVAPVAISQSSR
jgi:hypothetical protein